MPTSALPGESSLCGTVTRLGTNEAPARTQRTRQTKTNSQHVQAPCSINTPTNLMPQPFPTTAPTKSMPPTQPRYSCAEMIARTAWDLAPDDCANRLHFLRGTFPSVYETVLAHVLLHLYYMLVTCYYFSIRVLLRFTTRHYLLLPLQ